jgi:hypothetical protein
MVYYCIQIKRATKQKAPGGNILRTFLLRYILPSLFSVLQPLLTICDTTSYNYVWCTFMMS